MKLALRELRRRYPPELNDAHPVSHVLRTGEPELYGEIPDSVLVAAAKERQAVAP